MKKVYVTLLASTLAMGNVMAQTSTKPLILTGLPEYYVKGLSADGQWAYGEFLNYNDEGYGFRWNLRNDKVELLGGGYTTNEPTGISNTGVLVGAFKDNKIVPNGAYVETGGYWQDGAWHRVANPIAGAAQLTDDMFSTLKVSGITPDGHYMVGANSYKDILVWKDGVLDWQSTTGFTGVAGCLSADGQMAAGWSYEAVNGDQRMPVIWFKDKEPLYLEHAPVQAYTFMQDCYNFSNNGKYLLYWGGYNEKPNEYKMSLYAIYDFEQQKCMEIPCMTDYPQSIHYYFINSNGTAIGTETGRMQTGVDEDGYPTFGKDSTYLCMYKDGQVRDLYKYLKEQGVDFSSVPNFQGLNLGNGMSLTDDEKTFTFRYSADTLGGTYPMVIKLGENMTSRSPIQLEAQRIVGVDGVLLTWAEPLANAEGVKSYNVYRNGALLGNVSASTFRYVDSSVQSGQQYTYTVKAVYADTESEACDAATLAYNAATPQAPTSVYARQTREANGLLQWENPRSNLTLKRYYTDEDEVTGFGANGTDFECAINFPADEIALYKGQKLTSVNFYPMSAQPGWTLNVYSKDPATGELVRLYTQPITQTLNYGKLNTVKLTTPLALPEGKNLYVAIAVKADEYVGGYNVLGEVNGLFTAGCSDLLRNLTENEADFYSVYETSIKSGMLSADTWAIDAVFTPEGAKADIDEVAQYVVTVDGQEAGSTKENSFETSALSQGEHTLGVAAVYADGRRSPASEVKLTVKENDDYYVQAQNVWAEGKEGKAITAHWTIPTNTDATRITSAYGDFGRALASTEELFYNYRARAEYAPEMLKGYDGYKIKALSFYPCANSDYTLILYADGEEIAEVPVENYTLAEWNDVKLPTPVEVKPGVQYSLEVDCYDTEEGGAPLAVDNGYEVEGTSNLISTDEGENYSTLYVNNSIHGNWLMGLKVESDDERPLNVKGFNVVIDNKQVNTELVQGDSYDYTPASVDKRSHRLRVDAVYEVKGEVQGNVVVFNYTTGGPTGINDATVSEITVDRNGSVIKVNGADVQSVVLVAMDGKQVAASASNEVDVTAVPAGAYVLRVQLAGGEVRSQKILVK